MIIYVGDDIYGVKWRNWKMVTKQLDSGFGVPTKSFSIPLFCNLHLDPKEQHPMHEAEKSLWVRYPASQVLIEHLKTFREEPAIPPGMTDPYVQAKP